MPPGPIGIFSFSSTWKCLTSFFSGEALFLILHDELVTPEPRKWLLVSVATLCTIRIYANIPLSPYTFRLLMLTLMLRDCHIFLFLIYIVQLRVGICFSPYALPACQSLLTSVALAKEGGVGRCLTLYGSKLTLCPMRYLSAVVPQGGT